MDNKLCGWPDDDYEEGSFDDIDYLPKQRKDAKHLLTCVKDITTDSYTIKLAEKVLRNVQSADDLLRNHDEKALETDHWRAACIRQLENKIRVLAKRLLVYRNRLDEELPALMKVLKQ